MMHLPSDPAGLSHAAGRAPADTELRLRVHAEFREMPGLRLTLPQAARLFSLEPAHCARVLGTLVDAGILVTDGRAFTWKSAGPRRP